MVTSDSDDGELPELAEIVDESGHYPTDWLYIGANPTLFEPIGRMRSNDTFVTTFRYHGERVE